MIKMPNDVLLHKRKVAGILVETKGGHGNEFAAIVGIGVNVNQQLSDFPAELRERAGSLAMAWGREIPRLPFAVELLQRLEKTRLTMLYRSG